MATFHRPVGANRRGQFIGPAGLVAAVVVFVFAVAMFMTGAGVIQISFGVGEVVLEDLLGGVAFVAGGEGDAEIGEALLRPGPQAAGEDQIDGQVLERV